MRQPVQQDRMQARIAEQNLGHTGCGRIPIENGIDLLSDLSKHIPSDGLGPKRSHLVDMFSPGADVVKYTHLQRNPRETTWCNCASVKKVGAASIPLRDRPRSHGET